MHGSAVPLIAAVEGGAAGAGLSLVLACDMIVAASGAMFTAAYVKAGLIPDGGLTHALGQMVPRQMSMQMCLLGQSLPVERFFELGVIADLTPQGGALQAAITLAERLAQGPRQAQSRIRHLVAQAADTDIFAQLDQEAAYMVEAQGSKEAAEGIKAFFEKRPTEFK